MSLEVGKRRVLVPKGVVELWIGFYRVSRELLRVYRDPVRAKPLAEGTLFHYLKGKLCHFKISFN